MEKYEKHVNGSEIEIIGEINDYTLVYWPSNKHSPWIVTYHLTFTADGWYWQQGHYFSSFKNAIKMLCEKLDTL